MAIQLGGNDMSVFGGVKQFVSDDSGKNSSKRGLAWMIGTTIMGNWTAFNLEHHTLASFGPFETVLLLGSAAIIMFGKKWEK